LVVLLARGTPRRSNSGTQRKSRSKEVVYMRFDGGLDISQLFANEMLGSEESKK
jgi:hypothetical protein